MPISSFLATSAIAKPGVCTSSTRPASPFEGQVIYETDTDAIAVYNGTAWRYFAAATATNGSVLQVASATKTDTFTLNQSSYTDITGLSVSITPKASTSKILVRMYLSVGVASNERAFFQFVRGSTAIGIGDAASSRTQATIATLDSVINNQQQPVSAEFLDSPSTTSATTYKVQYRVPGGTSYLNRAVSDTDASYAARTISTITAMEIAA